MNLLVSRIRIDDFARMDRKENAISLLVSKYINMIEMRSIYRCICVDRGGAKICKFGYQAIGHAV